MTKKSTSRRSVIQSYSRLAGDYDRRWSFYLQATIRETLNRIDLRPGDHVLEVGCGTGALLAALAGRHSPELLAGMDPVPEMLAQARHRLPAAVTLKEGWAETVPFEDGQFDVVVSCSMFHYIRDPGDALAEMQRVLRPGGRLVISDWCDDYLSCRLCDLYLRWFDPAHFKTYRSHECEALLYGAGQQRVQVERYKISWLWGMMTAISEKERH